MIASDSAIVNVIQESRLVLGHFASTTYYPLPSPIQEGISRSYENIGRVYARNGKYKDAVSVWEMKLPLAENDMEKAWLYHEIGKILKFSK